MAIRNYMMHQTTSTLEVARKRWLELSPAPFAITAMHQTAGIGRAQSSWQSPTGGLWTTLAWPMQHPVAHYQALPLAVALTVAEAVQRLAPALPPIRIKWPNDLLVNDAKLAGILCIAHDSHPLEIYGKMIPMMIPTAMLIGVGVNVNFPASALGEDLRSPATSLQDLIGPVDLLALTTAVLVGLEEMLEAFDRAGFDVALARRVEERLAWVGERVAGELGGEEVTGNLLGIDENGLLRLETPAGEARRFLPSELRRLRAGA